LLRLRLSSIQHRLALFTSSCGGERCGSKNHYTYLDNNINDPTLSSVLEISNNYEDNERTIKQVALTGIEL
jgi:hypothetical protein